MTRGHTILLFATVLFAFNLLPRDCIARTWTDRQGRRVEADLVGAHGGTVTIKRKSDGRVFQVPLDKLSEEDQAFVNSQTAPDGDAADDSPLAKKYPVLARLTPPSNDLPPNCKIQEIPDDVPELKQLVKLAITVEPKFFLIVDERLKRVIDVKTINATYLGTYREKTDCGIVGWAFTNVDHAKKAHQALAAYYSNEKERFRLWQIDEYVVWLWRDPGISDASFQFFERFLNSQLKNPAQSAPRKQYQNQNAGPERPIRWKSSATLIKGRPVTFAVNSLLSGTTLRSFYSSPWTPSLRTSLTST